MHERLRITWPWIEAIATLWFFLQGLLVLFSTLFGLIYDALFSSTLSLVVVGLVLGGVLLVFLAPLLASRPPQRAPRAMALAAGLGFLLRMPLSLNVPSLRLGCSLGLIAVGGYYLASLIWRRPLFLGPGLVGAAVVQQLFVVLGHSYDLTLRPGWWPLAAGLSVLLLVGVGGALRGNWGGDLEQPPVRVGLWGGLGIGSFLFLYTALLGFPHAVLRYVYDGPLRTLVGPGAAAAEQLLEQGGAYSAAGPYVWAAPLLVMLPTVLLFRPRPPRGLPMLLLPGGLIAAVLLRPLDAGWALVGMICALLGAWLSLQGLLVRRSPEQRQGSGGAMVAGFFLFLVLHFSYAFAFTYPYTLALFRDKGGFVLLLAGLLAAWPLLLRGRVQWRSSRRDAPIHNGRTIGAVLLAVVAVGVFFYLKRTPAFPTALPGVACAGEEDDATLIVATYNIHYGYDEVWRFTLEEIGRTIERNHVDLIFLQEVDGGRPTSLMVDDALWLGQRLGMEYVYVPCVERLTGVALLTRCDFTEAETWLLPSELEQTGMARVKVVQESGALQAYGTWLGLQPEERARQLDAALEIIVSGVAGEGGTSGGQPIADRPSASRSAVAFGGDLNAEPDSAVYGRLVEAGFVDPFLALGMGHVPTAPAGEPRERIDYLWLLGLQPVRAWVAPSTASDHRLVGVEVRWPPLDGR